jgi:uncharacterized membrane protein
MNAANFFSKEEKAQIKDAVVKAETNTSGEIRVHIDNHCKEDVMDRAAWWFAKLEMQKTEKRNGVLFYLAVKDHKFAIIGDAGINAVTSDDFWDHIKEKMLEHFTGSEFAEGLKQGILKAGDALKEHFPYQDDDVNELSDEISFGGS